MTIPVDPSAPVPTGAPVPSAASAAAVLEYNNILANLNLTLEQRLALAKEVGVIEIQFAREVNELLAIRQKGESEFRTEATQKRIALENALKLEIAANQELADLTARRTELEAERVNAQSQILTLTAQRDEAERKRQEAFFDGDNEAQVRFAAERDAAQAQITELEKVKTAEEIIEAAREKARKAKDEDSKKAREDYALAQKRYVDQKEYNAGAQTLNRTFEKVGDTIFRTAKLSESFGGSLLLAFKGARAEGANTLDALKSVGDQLATMIKTQFSLERIVGGTLKTIQESTIGAIIQVDELEAAFNKTNGRGEQFKDTLLDASAGMSQFGVSRAQMGGAISALYEDYNNFSKANQKQQVELAQTTAKFEKLGISTKEYSKTLDLAVNAFHKTEAETKKMTEAFAQTAITIGVSTSKISKDFLQFADTLVVHGRNAEHVLTDLEKVSKATGVSMNTLFAIAGKFDTFESAATTTAGLNAVFGAQANALDMVNMKENERVVALRRMMDESGKSFQTMDRWEQKYLAQAAGFNSVAEASKFFSKSTADMTKAMEEQANTQKSLDDVMEKSATIKEKWNLLTEQAVVAVGFFVTALQTVVGWVTYLNDATGGRLVPIMGAVVGIVVTVIAALYSYAKAVQLINAIQAAWAARTSFATFITGLFGTTAAATAAPVAALGPAGAAGAGGIGAVGTAGAVAGPELLLLAVAVFLVTAGIGSMLIGLGMIVIGVGYVISSLVQFGKLMSQLTWQQIGQFAVGVVILVGALWLLVGSIAAMAPALAVAAPALLGLAAIIVGVGLAISGVILAWTLFKKVTEGSKADQAALNYSIVAVNNSLKEMDPTRLSAVQVALEGIKKVLSEMKVPDGLSDLFNKNSIDQMSRIVKINEVAKTRIAETSTTSEKISSAMASMSTNLTSVNGVVESAVIFRAENNPFAMLKTMIESATTAMRELNKEMLTFSGNSAVAQIVAIYEANAETFSAIQATSDERITKSTKFVEATKNLVEAKVEANSERIKEIIDSISGGRGGTASAGGGGVMGGAPVNLTFKVDLSKVKNEFTVDITKHITESLTNGVVMPIGIP